MTGSPPTAPRVAGLVSVAVPTYNRAALLRDAVSSILAQSYATLEVLIGDNSSADETPAVVASFTDPRVRAVRHATNLGMVGNWNVLRTMARGEFFLLLSDDDLLEPDALARLVGAMADPAVMLAYARVRYIGADGEPRAIARPAPARESGDSFIRASLAQQREVWPSAMLYRADSRTDEGYYREIGATADQWHRLRLATGGDVAFVDEPVVRYRVHEASESFRYDTVIDSYRQFRQLAAQPDSRLDGYLPEIDDCFARLLSGMACSAALRGRGAGRAAAIAALPEFARRVWPARLRAAWFATPLLRTVWKARAALRASRARGHGTAVPRTD